MGGERSPDSLIRWRDYVPYFIEDMDLVGLFSVRCDERISVKRPCDDASPEIMGLIPIRHKALRSIPAAATYRAVNQDGGISICLEIFAQLILNQLPLIFSSIL